MAVKPGHCCFLPGATVAERCYFTAAASNSKAVVTNWVGLKSLDAIDFEQSAPGPDTAVLRAIGDDQDDSEDCSTTGFFWSRLSRYPDLTAVARGLQRFEAAVAN